MVSFGILRRFSARDKSSNSGASEPAASHAGRKGSKQAPKRKVTKRQSDAAGGGSSSGGAPATATFTQLASPSSIPAEAPRLDVDISRTPSPPLVDVPVDGFRTNSPWVDLAAEAERPLPGSFGFSSPQSPSRPVSDKLQAFLDERRITVEQATVLVRECSKVIQEQGLETLGIFRPWRLAESPYIVSRTLALFIRAVSPDETVPLEDRDLLGVLRDSEDDALAAFAYVLRDAGVHNVVACLKWGFRHLKYGSGGFADSLESNPWGFYTHFIEAESRASYPPDAFSSLFVKSIPASHAELLTESLALFACIAAHDAQNAMSGLHLCRLMAFWLLGRQHQQVTTFTELYYEYQTAASCLEHLFLAYLRNESKLPPRLKELITPYPPLSKQHASADIRRTFVTTPDWQALLVVLTRTTRSATPSQQNGSHKRLPGTLLASALQASRPADDTDNQLYAYWDGITSKTNEADGVSLHPIVSDEAERIFGLVAERTQSKKARLSKPWHRAQSGSGHRRRSASVDVAATQRTVRSDSVSSHRHRALSNIGPAPPLPGIDVDITWGDFETRGFSDGMESDTFSLFSDVGRPSMDEEATPRPHKLKKPYPYASLASRHQFGRLYTSASEEDDTNEESVGAKRRNCEIDALQVMHIDPVFAELYLDSLADLHVTSKWPLFAIAELKGVAAPYSALVVEMRAKALPPASTSAQTFRSETVSGAAPTTTVASSKKVGGGVKSSSKRQQKGLLASFGRKKRVSDISGARGSAASSAGSAGVNELGQIGELEMPSAPTPKAITGARTANTANKTPLQVSDTQAPLPKPIERPSVPIIIKTSPLSPPQYEYTTPQRQAPTVDRVVPTTEADSSTPSPTGSQASRKKISRKAVPHGDSTEDFTADHSTEVSIEQAAKEHEDEIVVGDVSVSPDPRVEVSSSLASESPVDERVPTATSNTAEQEAVPAVLEDRAKEIISPGTSTVRVHAGERQPESRAEGNLISPNQSVDTPVHDDFESINEEADLKAVREGEAMRTVEEEQNKRHPPAIVPAAITSDHSNTAERPLDDGADESADFQKSELTEHTHRKDEQAQAEPTPDFEDRTEVAEIPDRQDLNATDAPDAIMHDIPPSSEHATVEADHGSGISSAVLDAAKDQYSLTIATQKADDADEAPEGSTPSKQRFGGTFNRVSPSLKARFGIDKAFVAGSPAQEQESPSKITVSASPPRSEAPPSPSKRAALLSGAKKILLRKKSSSANQQLSGAASRDSTESRPTPGEPINATVLASSVNSSPPEGESASQIAPKPSDNLRDGDGLGLQRAHSAEAASAPAQAPVHDASQFVETSGQPGQHVVMSASQMPAGLTSISQLAVASSLEEHSRVGEDELPADSLKKDINATSSTLDSVVPSHKTSNDTEAGSYTETESQMPSVQVGNLSGDDDVAGCPQHEASAADSSLQSFASEIPVLQNKSEASAEPATAGYRNRHLASGADAQSHEAKAMEDGHGVDNDPTNALQSEGNHDPGATTDCPEHESRAGCSQDSQPAYYRLTAAQEVCPNSGAHNDHDDLVNAPINAMESSSNLEEQSADAGDPRPEHESTTMTADNATPKGTPLRENDSDDVHSSAVMAGNTAGKSPDKEGVGSNEEVESVPSVISNTLTALQDSVVSVAAMAASAAHAITSQAPEDTESNQEQWVAGTMTRTAPVIIPAHISSFKGQESESTAATAAVADQMPSGSSVEHEATEVSSLDREQLQSETETHIDHLKNGLTEQSKGDVARSPPESQMENPQITDAAIVAESDNGSVSREEQGLESQIVQNATSHPHAARTPIMPSAAAQLEQAGNMSEYHQATPPTSHSALDDNRTGVAPNGPSPGEASETSIRPESGDPGSSVTASETAVAFTDVAVPQEESDDMQATSSPILKELQQTQEQEDDLRESSPAETGSADAHRPSPTVDPHATSQNHADAPFISTGDDQDHLAQSFSHKPSPDGIADADAPLSTGKTEAHGLEKSADSDVSAEGPQVVHANASNSDQLRGTEASASAPATQGRLAL